MKLPFRLKEDLAHIWIVDDEGFSPDLPDMKETIHRVNLFDYLIETIQEIQRNTENYLNEGLPHFSPKDYATVVKWKCQEILKKAATR